MSSPFALSLSRTLALSILLAVPVAAQEARIASDFEIATAQRRLERAPDPLLRLAEHLNLGDLYLSRREVSVAQDHYRSAEALAQTERLNARRRSDLSSYATATGYLGLAHAMLGRTAQSVDAFEEAIRYASDSAPLWNLYATAMSVLEQPRKAVAAARTAVAIASGSAGDSPPVSTLVSFAVYRYALATALLSLGEPDANGEAENLFVQILETLQGPRFEGIRDQIARQEKFEIFSTTRTDADSYLALINRARLRLARLYEEQGDRDRAVAQLEKVLELRTDDPNALTALARLTTGEARERYFAEAFEANPFSMALIREYERHVAQGGDEPLMGESPGRLVQRAVHAYATGHRRRSSDILAELAARYPENEVVRFLVARNERIEQTEAATPLPKFLLRENAGRVEPAELDLQRLAAAMRLNRLNASQRALLDRLTFSSIARFDQPLASTDSTTTFATGSIGAARFRFQQPTEFRGRFTASQPLRIDYRVLGVTEHEGETALLFEPLRIAAP